MVIRFGSFSSNVIFIYIATAAYQIEGGISEDNKGPNIWDVWSHGSVTGVGCGFDANIKFQEKQPGISQWDV